MLNILLTILDFQAVFTIYLRISRAFIFYMYLICNGVIITSIEYKLPMFITNVLRAGIIQFIRRLSHGNC